MFYWEGTIDSNGREFSVKGSNIIISNDSAVNEIKILTNEAVKGTLKPIETIEFKCYVLDGERLKIKCLTGTAEIRVWIW